MPDGDRVRTVSQVVGGEPRPMLRLPARARHKEIEMTGLAFCLTYGALVIADDYINFKRQKPARAGTAIFAFFIVVLGWKLTTGSLL